MIRNPRPVRLALDRSSRSYDKDGHLRVADNTLTAVGVSPYYGRELPGSAKLGLDPDRIYRMLRPASELRKAAASLAGKPILAQHQEISANDHPHKAVVGAVGSDIAFDGKVLKSSLIFWTSDAIEAIEYGGQRSLSCGYFFTPDMTPGTYQGEPYDGVMRELGFNHLAMCVEGRVPLAMIGDSTLKGNVKMDDDDLSELLKFLAPRLEDDDLEKVKTMLGVEDDDQPAMDAARVRQRQIAAQKNMREFAESRESLERRFPGAFQLKNR